MIDAANKTDSIDAVIGSGEELITLAQAAGLLPRIDGRKVCVCTIWRWCRRGLRGVYLDYCRVGRRVCTSRPALLRFFTAVAELDRQVSPVQAPQRHDGQSLCRSRSRKRRPITSRRRQRALAEADAVLERAGI